MNYLRLRGSKGLLCWLAVVHRIHTNKSQWRVRFNCNYSRIAIGKGRTMVARSIAWESKRHLSFGLRFGSVLNY